MFRAGLQEEREFKGIAFALSEEEFFKLVQVTATGAVLGHKLLSLTQERQKRHTE